MEIKKYSLSVMATIIALTLTGCDIKPQQKQSVTFNLTEQQWQNEIQQRFDTINGNGEPINCILLLKTNPPYYIFDRYKNSNEFKLLQRLTEAGLLTEQIDIYKNSQDKNVYIYNLTEEGKKHHRIWPNISQSGFCLGKVIVKSITQITPHNSYVEIKYQYIIDKLPPKLEPQNQLKTNTARFSYDEQTKQLYSEWGIGLIVNM
ncbi:hypothetical protein [Gilliamella intestini]|uniref:Lipoprotein n=1 Tax=Gilliamella intestini TaxID=1798183 RepID=A0A1C4AIG1_9GAMM|nr:hypothetical protein [Gilliamella intestini]SCB94327.1 hypothetical protein GA0061080_101129 [Gilliamella intestini]